MEEQHEGGRRRIRRRSNEVERLVDEFEASGLSPTVFCRSRGLAPSTLQRHLRARRRKSESPGCRLVAVSVGSSAETKPKSEQTGLEVLLRGGVRIGVRAGFDPGTLRALITVLERA
jgi:hypothetical protein